MKVLSENWRLPEVIRGLAMNKQIYIQVPLQQVSQQKGASESSRIYEVKHVFRQNNDVFL